MIMAFWPGFRKAVEDMGPDFNFIYMGLGFLFIYTAVLSAEKTLMSDRLSRFVRDVAESLKKASPEDGERAESDRESGEEKSR